MPEFLREERHPEKAVREICSPGHLLPGTYIHLMAANSLQAELIGENDQLQNQWPTDWVLGKWKVHQNYLGEFAISGHLRASLLVMLTHVSLPSGVLITPTAKNGPRNGHRFRIIQRVYEIWGLLGAISDLWNQKS